MKFLQFAFAALSASVSCQTSVPYDIQVNGESKSIFVVGNSWYGDTGSYDLNVTGSNIAIPFGGRMMLASQKQVNGTWTPDEFYTPNLVGGSIEYDVFIGAECKNAASQQPTTSKPEVPKGYGLFDSVYLSAMPGIGVDGKPVPSTRGDFYCDSVGYNNGDPVCQEIDVMESSYFEYRTGVHTCEAADSDGWIKECDMDGCNAYVEKQYTNTTFGWGDEYSINTINPFHTKIEFEAGSDGEVVSVTTTITQGDQDIVSIKLGEEYCDSGYIKNISGALSKGMVFIASNWGNLQSLPTPTISEEVIWGIPPFKSGCPYDYMPDMDISNIQFNLNAPHSDSKEEAFLM